VQHKWQIPEALDFLFEPARYKVAYGGRGGSKSWGFARALLIQGWMSPLRILCAREFQSSIADSVHRLLADQVAIMGLEDFYQIKQQAIVGINGTEFGFDGLRHNVNKIKSYEGVDRVWIEEANTVSRSSWEVLIPTIRKAGSEIWVSFNPELSTDETYQRFVVKPPPGAVVHKLTWRDNPWFNEVMRQEMETLKARDEDAYLTIWEGNCRVTLDGAIYANELRQATADGRITRVPLDMRTPVHTFWDLGFSDCTSIWFAQKVGFEYHLIDFYQNRLQLLQHYLKVLQDKGYVYGVHHLPHDAEHDSLGAPSIKRQMEDAQHKIKIISRIPKVQMGINATRALWNRIWIDEVKCAEGLQDLRHYRYDVNDDGQWSKEPKHDQHSHAADALRTLGESIGVPDQKQPDHKVEIVNYSRGDEAAMWMG
jgi:phage terminase large subunit